MRRLLPPVAAIAALTAATAAFGAANGTAYLHVSRSVYVGDQAHVVLQPAPAGLCRITVSKGRTRVRAKREVRQGLGLYPKRSLGRNDYRVAWTWTVEPKWPDGWWRIRIHCSSARPVQTEFKKWSGF